MHYEIFIFVLVWFDPNICKCDLQSGPDPWNYEAIKLPNKVDEDNLPPDLKTPLKKEKRAETNFGFGEWWFKRLLAITLKSGQVKKSEDGSILVSLQMRFDENKWEELNTYLKSEATLSDTVFRKSVGYVEEAIYKPTITEKIVTAWSEYIQIYFIQYKAYITWILGTSGIIGTLLWLWKYVSHKHIIIVIFVLLYIYEVIISYMEAEQQEYQKFISAINTCKWYFWTTECTVPSPDPILFLKHMNPMKIAIRMFTTLICEPVLAINDTVKLTLLDITSGLWFPIDKIVYGFLIVIINISLIYLLIMTIFNFIFNIPFNFNFFGIIGINIKQNRQSLFSVRTSEGPSQNGDTDRISGDRLDRLLNVCSLALANVQNKPSSNKECVNNGSIPKLQRSASTGRLPTLCSLENKNDKVTILTNLKRRVRHEIGGGDH